MKKQNSRSQNTAPLRQKAEQELKLHGDKIAHVPVSEADLLKLIHELKVHQVELELQNEELIHSKHQEEIAREKYSNLFDFAPSGYFTLSLDGKILEINLAGASMLRKERRGLIQRKLALYLTVDTRATFADFLKNISEKNTTQNCKVACGTNLEDPIYLHLTGNLGEDGQQYLITAVDVTDQTHSEIALGQSEVKFRQLSESSTFIVYRLLLKPELKFDYVSPSATVITGYTPQDHYNDPQLGFKLVHPDDRVLLDNTTQFSSGEPLELRWIRKDGQVIWTEQRNILFFDENNEPYAIEGNARDITDRKIREIGIQKEAERNSLLLDLFAKAPGLTDKELYDSALEIAVKITDSSIGFFHQVSDNQQEIILTTWSEVAKKHCTTVYDDHYPLDKAGNWADCIRQKKAVVYNDYSQSQNKKGLPDGHVSIERFLSAPVVSDNQVHLIFGVGNKGSDYSDLDLIQIQAIAGELHKILEKRKIEQSLKKIEDRWQFAIEGGSDGIWDWNILTDELFFSNRWKEMLGFGQDELGNDISEWQKRVHPDDLQSVLLSTEKHLKAETPDYVSEYRMLCKDGTWKWILDRGKVLEWTHDGKPSRMVGTHSDIHTRKIVEESIRLSEEKFRIVADNAYNWEFWEGADGQWIHHSPSCQRITGYAADEFMQDPDLLRKIIHPDDWQDYSHHHSDSKTGKGHGRHFFRIVDKAGEIRHIEHVCQQVFTDAGSFIGIRGSNIDITDRKKAELQIQESEFQYRNLANSGSALIWTSGTDKLCNYFNDIWLSFTGRTLELELGNGWAEGVHQDDMQRCLETYIKAFDNRQPFSMEYRLRHYSGEYRWLLDLGTPNYNSRGEFLGYIGHCFDISERKLTEMALLESEAKYRSIFETVEEVYFEASLNGTLLEVSPSIEKITKGQYTRKEMMGQSFIGIYAYPGERDNYFSKLFNNKKVNDYELPLRNRDGSVIPVAISSALTFDESGNPVKVTGILRDITERKIAEVALKESLEQLNLANLNLERRVEERTLEIVELSSLQKAILSNAPLTIMTNNESGIYQSVNPAGEKMLGYSAEEIIGKMNPFSFHDREEMVKFCQEKTGISNPTDDEIFQAVMQYMFHRTTEWTWIRRNGERFPIRITHSSIIDENGNLQGYMGLIDDITQERLALESIRESEERFHNMFYDHSAVMLLINPDNGAIIEANKAAGDFYGFSDEEMHKLNISDINALPVESVLAEMEEALSQNHNYFVFPHRTSRREIRTVEVHSTPIIVRGEKVLFSIIHDITERKSAENALRKSEAENRAIIQAVPDLMFRISRDGTYLDSNSQNESSLYVPRDFFIGKNISEILPPDLAAQSMQAIGKSFSTGEVEHYEYSLSVKDRDRYFENRIIAISDNEVLSIIRDITERKDSETALKMQSAAFESFALTIIITDTAGHIQWVNPAFTKLTGYTVEEAMGKTPGELVSSGKLGDEFYAGFWETLLNKRVWSGEILNRRKDGSLYHEQETITPVLDPQGNVSSYIAIKIDITETKKAQEELLWNKSFLELMSNSSPLGFLVVDNRNDEILYFNKRFCQIWELEQIQDQMERGELKNNDIIPYCLLVLADIPAFAESCTPLQDEENRIIIEDEIPFTENRAVRRFTTQIRGANDEYYGRFYIFEDITDRKRAESDLRKARNEAVSANLAKSEFLSRMSHELRTPMNSILGFAQLLEMGDLNPRQKKGVSHILNNGKHLLELINEVLDISGIEAGRQHITTEPVKLAGIINEVKDSIHVAADKRRVSVTLADSPSNKLFVRADRLRLRQILINLLNNAIKYNKEGGSVVIETKLKRFPEAVENRIRISISDTGNGILPEDIGKLFQPFERIGAGRTETEGTGLGLVVVKKLTEAMGGIIGVDSTFGQGSTFWIELATSDQEGTAGAENQGETMLDFQVRKGNSTVLYIEDNLSNIELVEQIISEYRPGIKLVKSIFGRQTLELAKECKPDVILLDLNLPDMKGDDILDELMADEDTKSIPVIIISADAMPFHINKLMERGASDYLTKPLDMFQLLRSFDEYIRLE